MKKTILLFAGLAFLTFKNQAQTTVTDIDGNVYNTVTIGTQVWLKENLKVTHYRNGNAISNVTDNTAWGNLITGARCYYNNDSAINAPVYGALYNWFAATDVRKICPTGWHLPSDGEWNKMEKYLDNTVDTTATGWSGTDIGGILKEDGTIHWASPNTGATNSIKFTALPGGYRQNNGSFVSKNNLGYWWTSTAYDATNSWDRALGYNYASVYRHRYSFKVDGSSVRCLCDFSANINDINETDNIQIYPNPAIDRVYINCIERQNLKMQIYNVIGECVMQRELDNGTNDIDISSLMTGIYVIQLTGTDGTFQRKLIKE